MLLFLMICLNANSVDLSKLEMYTDNGYSACRQAGDLFIVSRGDNRIVKIDAKGSVIAVFAQQGKGPYELEYPTIVGANNHEVLILNRAKELLFLTPDLKVIKDKVSQVSNMLTQGVLLRDNIVAFAAYGISAGHCVKLFQVNERDPVLKASFGKTSGNYQKKETFERSFLDNSEFFLFKPFLDQVSDYKISVFKYDLASETLVQTLKSNLEDIKENNKNYYIGQMVHTKNGYLVSIEQASSTHQLEQTYIDHFNKKGGFIRRESTKARIFLVPIINSDEDFKVDIDALKAVFL